MIQFPTGTKIWLALGRTDLRRGAAGLALLVQETLKLDPHSGHFFRGKKGDLIKAIWHNGQRACPFAKRLETGRFQLPAGERRQSSNHARAGLHAT